MRTIFTIMLMVGLACFVASTASAQVTVYSPAVTVPAPIVAPPAVVYRPFVPAVVAPPVVVYRPFVPAPVVVAPRAVYYGPRAVVRTRFFVPGQPIRNYWRAVLP